MEKYFEDILKEIKRKWYLAKYLLKNGYPLQKILYLMDIEGYKLESYLSIDEIEETFWNKPEEPVIDLDDWHPMEKFLEQLRELVEKSQEKE